MECISQQNIKELAGKFLYGQTEHLKYRYFMPDGVGGKLPLVLYLHGAGLTGEDNELHVSSMADAVRFVCEEMQSRFPCCVLVPQLSDRYVSKEEEPTNSEPKALGWNDPEAREEVFAAIHSLCTVCSVDEDRIYILGHSMGAAGVWGYITEYPDFFAAAVPVSGLYRGDVQMLEKLPMWIFHGKNDRLVPIENQEDAMQRIRKLGNSRVRWTVYGDEELYAEAGIENAHMANLAAFADEKLYEWLFVQHR